MSQASLEDLIQIGPEGLHYIAGGTGLNTSIKLTKDRTERFFYEFEQFLYKYDYIIFDIGAGMTEELILFLESINEIIVVCTPEPTSVIDAYSAMKLILLHTDNISFYLLGNRMRSVRESNEALIRLQNVMSQFLHYDSKIIGYLPEDPSINKAVRHQTPFILFKPNSAAAKNIRSIAEKFINDDDFTTAGINMNREPQFLERLKNLLLRK